MGQPPEPRSKSWIKPGIYDCEINRATYPYAKYSIPGPCVAWTHNGCKCNQYVALAYRHQVATPQPTFNYDSILEIFDRLLAKNPVVLVPYKRHKVVNGYSGSWRAKYFEAQQKYHEIGLLDRHSRVTLFCKDDLEMGVPAKAPRAIQYRNPIFALEQGRFTKPIEKWFYSLRDQYDTIIIGKADPFTIANALAEKSKHFSDPVYLMLDASKFDSCVDIRWLQICLSVYLRLFPGRFHRTINYIWKKTFLNQGRTRKGLRFKTSGTRMSGDMDTGLGNSIIMVLMLTAYMETQGVRHSLLVNGDDSLIVISKADLEKARDISCFKSYGFNMKFEVAHTINQAEFCQSRYMESDYGPTMARKPARIMGRTSWTTRDYGQSKIRAFVNTLGLCERAASFGVPIASTMATCMIQAAQTTKQIELKPWLKEHYLKMKKPWKTGHPTISLEARLSFQEAWDISPEEQLDIENSIKVKLMLTRHPRHEEEYEELINN
jgi:hypothetical protein